jgi:hypothetical protein
MDASSGTVLYTSDPCSVQAEVEGGGNFTTWAGITCLSSPLLCWNTLCNITQLHLSEHNLTGFLPTSLGALRGLERLMLDGNRLTSTLPSTLGDLTDLSRLDVENNFLSGELPTSLGRLEKMDTLYLRNNFLTGTVPSELSQLTNLFYMSTTTTSMDKYQADSTP